MYALVLFGINIPVTPHQHSVAISSDCFPNHDEGREFHRCSKYFALIVSPIVLLTYDRRFGCSSNLHSSEKRTLSHFSTGQFILWRHHRKRFLRWRKDRKGFRTATRPNNPCRHRVRFTVLMDTTPVRFVSCRTFLAVHVGLPLEIRATLRSIRLFKMRGLPLFSLSATCPVSLNCFMMYCTDLRLTCSVWAISF